MKVVFVACVVSLASIAIAGAVLGADFAWLTTPLLVLMVISALLVS